MSNDQQTGFLHRELKRIGLQVAKRLVREQSQTLLTSFFEVVLEKLVDFSRDKSFVGTHHEYFYAHAKLNQCQPQIERAFLRYIELTLDQFVESGILDCNRLLSDSEELSLVANDEMEERVAIIAIRQRADDRFQEPIWALNKHMSLLGQGQVVSANTNPLAPVRFCLALRDALSDIEIATNAKTVVYKMFERRFVGELGVFYRQLNRRLNEVGLNPNLTFGVVKSRETVNLRAAYNDAGQPETRQKAGWLTGRRVKAAEQTDSEQQRKLYEGIKALQSQTPRMGQGGGLYTSADMSAAITEMQRQELARSQLIAPPSTSEALRSRDIAKVTEAQVHQLALLLNQSKGGDLHQDDMQTINLVGMLFNYMLNDEHLPDTVKALLSYLHTPLLKLACSDPDFFQQAEHPARQLLNRFAEVGMAWLGSDGSSQFGVYERMKASIERLLNDMSNEVRPFTEELLSFNSFIKRLELKVKMRERRATEQAQGEDRMNEVRQRVHEELSERIGERQLPSAILMFLLQPWFDYMSQVLIRGGDDSDLWREACALVDDMLWGVELTAKNDERRRWSQHYPWIESMIGKGFEVIGYEEGRQQRMMSAIHHVYQQKLKDLEVKPAPEAVRSRLVRLAERNAGVKQGRYLSVTEQQCLEQLKEIPFDTWFEFDSGRREKVVWYNLRTMQFLFVDQSSHRSGLRTGYDIARLMAEGTMRIIEMTEQPLVDRTLEQIYSDLQAASGD